MNTKQLVTFITLAKEKNYIKASELLNYAPSTLAKQIHSLENEFDTTLVEFKNGRIELTVDGEKLLPFAEEMLRTYEQMQHALDPTAAMHCIRVAGGELMVGFAFGEFFAEFEKRYRSIGVAINAICCARVPEWLDQQLVDIGFVQVLDAHDAQGQQVIPLFEEPLCLMCANDHPLVQKESITLKDLDGMDFSYTYEDCCFTDEFRSRLRDANVHPSSELFLGSIHAVIHTAKEDQRLCLIPYVCKEQVKTMGLVELDWADHFNIYDVILWPIDKPMSPGILQLVEQAKAYAANFKKRENTQAIRLIDA